MKNGLKVAVAGASGIGKHHAKWHHLCGSEVVAFLGSSPASCRATAAALGELFPFCGRGYCDMAELLRREAPDIVDVCTPNDRHYEVAMGALEAGCHVLCEKPLVWQEPVHADDLLAQGRRLASAAEAAGTHLGVCTQYAASLTHYRRLCADAVASGTGITQFAAEMETLSRGRDRSAHDIWVDMGSHPLSILLAWLPDGAVTPGSARVTMRGKEARARFEFATASGGCAVDVAVRDRPEGPPVRRFGVNGAIAEVSGRGGEDGVYRSVLSRGGQEDVGQDYMHFLIAQFTAVVLGQQRRLLVPAATGLRNLQLQLDLLAAAQSA